MGRTPVKMYRRVDKHVDFQPPRNIEPESAGVMRIALAVLALLLLIIFGVSHGHAQALPDAPQPKQQVHAFMDATNLSNFFGTVSATSAEVGQACSADNIGARNCKTLQLAGAAYVSGSVLAAGVLHKTGHHSLERMLPLTVTLLHVARMSYVSLNRKAAH